jgi:hypothetical protein
MDVLNISCDTCAMRASPACGDCLVTFLCEEGDDDAARAGALVLDIAEQRAVRMLVAAGLVPTIRHRATG